MLLAAARNCGNLAAESAGLHGCKRGIFALTAMPRRTLPSTASKVCCAGLAPALDPVPGRHFSCPVFLAAPDFRGFRQPLTTKRSTLKAIPREKKLGQLLCRVESDNASIRSKVEDPFHVVKNLFSHRKVRYKGLKGNTAPVAHPLCPGQSGVIAKLQLLALDSPGVS